MSAPTDLSDAAAYRLRHGDDKLARGTLEGRLLAGEPIPEVAAACGLTPGVVEAYHELFFDVRERLDAAAWVHLYAVGWTYPDEPTGADADALLRRAGYTGGPALLDHVLALFRDGCGVPARLPGLTREQVAGLRDRLQARAVVLVWTLPAERVHRAALLQGVVDELTDAIGRWPGGQEGPPEGLAVSWPALRRLADAASTGRGLAALWAFQAA